LVLDQWAEITDNGGSIDSVYVDFLKSFDKVPHRRFMKKMEHYGTAHWSKTNSNCRVVDLPDMKPNLFLLSSIFLFI
jgi:hypothetical protein